jgi:hypothetical protein
MMARSNRAATRPLTPNPSPILRPFDKLRASGGEGSKELGTERGR